MRCGGCCAKKGFVCNANAPGVSARTKSLPPPRLSASWLNQVEIWFGILSRKALRGASLKNVTELCQAIEAFIAAYNPKAKPFKWRKRDVQGSQLRNTIVNLCN